MKKLLFVLILCLFTLGTDASGSDGIEPRGPGYEMQVGDWIKRPDPCKGCGANSAWEVMEINEFGAYLLKCVECGYDEWK